MKNIRNPQGVWINSNEFIRTAEYFKKNNYYTNEPVNSPNWINYWTEEKRRCIYGYNVGGAKITGDHYFYLNFCPIKKVESTNTKRSRKINTFPDFWDGDYYYFWIRSIAKYGIVDSLIFSQRERKRINNLKEEEKLKKYKKLYDSLGLNVAIDPEYLNGGYNLIIGKSRRKGYSYKAASIGANNYFTKPRSLTIYGAYTKQYLYPQGIFSMAYNNINFINKNTGWAMPSDVINKPGQGHIKSSFVQYINGIRSERGFNSEILALTFQDNPHSARGKDAEDIFFEESGAFGTPGLLKDSYTASQDCVMAGNIKTGLITVFGTSGDMEGGTADYANMFNKPKAYDFLPFYDTWSEDSTDETVGFFHPINLNMEGFYDKYGNSDTEKAKEIELAERKKLIKNGATSSDIQRRQQEKPLNPSEAFGNVSVNLFPTEELKRRLRLVLTKNYQSIYGTPVEFYYHQGKIRVKVISSEIAEPITSYNNLPKNKKGCVVIYENPIYNPPKGLYKIGYDPVRQDAGTSLASIFVLKGVYKDQQTKNILVAEYIGRKESADDNDKIAELLAEYYNTQIMYENEVSSVKNYFRRIKKLNLLSAQPDSVISKNIRDSKVSRVYGCHMNLQLKDAGERYMKDWLTTVLDYDSEGNPIIVIDTINSVRLLEELISYNRKGNFDLISSGFMALIQMQEESLNQVYGEDDKGDTYERIINFIEKQYA